MKSAVIEKEVRPLAASVVEDIEALVRESEAEMEEERPLLYFTSPVPGVRYYSFGPSKATKPAR